MGLLGPVGSDVLSVLWSVCVEEQFYLLAPLLLVCLRRRVRTLFVVALMVVLLNLIVDVSYSVIDPRVKLR